MAVRGMDIDPAVVVIGTRHVADGNHFHPVLVRQSEGGNASDVSKTLDDSGSASQFHLHDMGGALDQVDGSPAGGLPASVRTADTDWFAGNNFWHGVSFIG